MIRLRIMPNSVLFSFKFPKSCANVIKLNRFTFVLHDQFNLTLYLVQFPFVNFLILLVRVDVVKTSLVKG